MERGEADGRERGGPADDMVAQRLDGGGRHVVAASDGEAESEALGPVRGTQDDVGCRVVGVRVHRVGAVELLRGGEADVVDLEPGDALTHARAPSCDQKNIGPLGSSDV
ncbi:hypothetical protein GCM10023082_28090 [Streptomyces tremellae]|uniref:Uncharacterized protein n=1 Tax=Streptomyces tremellae TaxID=1124239 RepID=A0ABP7EZY7_9ACTN